MRRFHPSTGNTRWIEYLFQLFEATRAVMPAEGVAIVSTAARRVNGPINLLVRELGSRAR